MKKGEKGLLKRWKKRWCWYDPSDHSIKYCESPATRQNVFGSIDLRSAKAIDSFGDGTGWAFEINTPVRSYELTTISEAERASWIALVNAGRGASPVPGHGFEQPASSSQPSYSPSVPHHSPVHQAVPSASTDPAKDQEIQRLRLEVQRQAQMNSRQAEELEELKNTFLRTATLALAYQMDLDLDDLPPFPELKLKAGGRPWQEWIDWLKVDLPRSQKRGGRR